MSVDLFIVAGEASADLHAAELLKHLRRLHPELRAFGIGGENLKREGMEIITPASALSVVGIADWLDKAKEIFSIYRSTVRAVETRRPTAALLLDLPDFNLRLARKIKAHGIPVTYYISPQVWAWRKYRIGTIKKYIDRMLVVFPFEKEFYDRQGVASEFVGHPLLDSLPPRNQYREGQEIRRAPRIALLPGSRRSELRFHAALLNSVIETLSARYPAAQFQIPIANTLDADLVKKSFPGTKITFTTDSRVTLEWADVALVASGTATLETALIGTPFSLFYRVSASSAWIFKRLVRYRGLIGMPNILLKSEVAREFFQDQATPEALLAETERLLQDDHYRENQAAQLRSCRESLGTEGASRRAAYFVHRSLPKTPTAPIYDSPSLLDLKNAPVPT